jgi:hypothetical protein
MMKPDAGTATRPTLSFPYERNAQLREPRRKRRSPTLSTRELRRLVAAMVD